MGGFYFPFICLGCSFRSIWLFRKVQWAKLRYKNCDTIIGPTGYSRFSNAEKANPMTTKIYQVSMEEFLDQNCMELQKMNQAPTAITAYGYNPNAMWMPLPPSFAICPPGLEYLSQIDWLLIHQKYEILELITSFETANKYEVRNRLGEMVYFATEENNFCVRNCLGSLRPFTMVISNQVGQQVIHLVRPFRCAGCCCPCCLQELEIQAPPGLPIGYIKQLWHPYLPKFVIQNEAHRDVLKIIGPCITSACCGDVVFEVMALDEQSSVGKIAKQWGGVLQEFFTDVDFLGISFPLDLDVKMKAVMLGAGFLLDFIFFESGAGARNERFTVWS